MADEKIVSDDVDKDDIEGGEDKPDKKESKETETETEEETEEIKEDDFEVPVRETTLQHIIARKNKQIERLKEKKEGEEEPEPEEGEGEELTPEAKRALENELDKRFAPFREREISLESERLMSKLYEDEPEAKPYDKVIRKFINYADPKTGVKPYEHIPPSVIYHHLAFDTAESTGAKKKEAANLEANLSRTRGRGIKPKGGRTESGLPHVEDMEEMSDEEFNRKIIGPAMQG